MSRSLGVNTVLILTALDRGVRYGLDIVNRTGMLAGTVYTTLRRLERRGMIAGQWEDAEIAESERRPRRRYYVLTPSGEEALEAARARFEELGVDVAARIPTAG
jgi:DNA-binding PadR family transcriptional regulator